MLLFYRVLGSLLGASIWLKVASGEPPSNVQRVFIRNDPRCSDSVEYFCGTSSKISVDHTGPENLERWIMQQKKRSFEYLLDNVAPNGSNAKDAAPGTVIASPSKENPNYYYQWIRDAAITMGDVVDEYGKTADGKLKTSIDYYADLQGILQNTFNPSGGYTTGGLGEPKFEVDGAPFTENWGRPQRDGPALRALVLMSYIRTLNNTNPYLLEDPGLQKLYDGKLPTRSIIKADLEYTSKSWKLSGFDLWEEISDLHFYTATVQHRALVEGRDLAAALGDSGASDWYEIQQRKLKRFLETSFWDSRRGHLKSMLNTPRRGGLDCSLLLGALHGGTVFPAWSDEILASLEKLVADMATRYPINMETLPYCPAGGRLGVGIGRYPEDVYDGCGITEGNPWFLCTASVSSILYRTIARYIEQRKFNINETNKHFFKWIHSGGNVANGSYASEKPEFQEYLISMFKYADSFMNVIRRHATEDGRMSEQFNKYTGIQQGAKDLTWSYGSFIGAANDRETAKLALLKIIKTRKC